MFEALEWREPVWLWLVLLPWILWLGLKWRQKNQQQTYADAHLWPWVQASTTINPLSKGDRRLTSGLAWIVVKVWRSLTPLKFLGFAWIMLAVALAEPRQLIWQSNVSDQPSMDVMVVLDLSPSMAAKDVYPSRFLQAKQLIESFAAELNEQDRLGLIGFSGQAHLITPVTQDRRLFQHFLDLLEPDLLPIRGSGVEFGILSAMAYFQQSLAQTSQSAPQHANQQSPAILVISDGRALNSQRPPLPEGEASLQQLSQAIFAEGGRETGKESAKELSQMAMTPLPTAIIGVGTKAATVLADPEDPQIPWRRGESLVNAPLGEAMLQQLSEQMNQRFQAVYLPMQTTRTFVQQLEQTLRVPRQPQDTSQQAWHSFAGIFVSLSLFGLLFAFYPLSAWRLTASANSEKSSHTANHKAGQKTNQRANNQGGKHEQ